MKIKRFIECLIPFSVCNFRCEYCYVVQQKRNNNPNDGFNFPMESVAKCLTRQRLGGVCYFNLCALGETLLCKQTVMLAELLLREGHFVNITTNGTITKSFDALFRLEPFLLQRLGFSFSFHYLELLRSGLLQTFWDNIENAKRNGCSILVQFNMYDGYIPHLETMKQLCLAHVGAPPQIAATRLHGENSLCLHTALSRSEYTALGNGFNSELFKFTMQNFMKKNKFFCYAGDWSLILNIGTGEASRCYGMPPFQNIFVDPAEAIRFDAVGYACNMPYCVNSSHFKALGITPSEEGPTYAQLRNRSEAGWYNDTMRDFLSTKLQQSNAEYSFSRKIGYWIRCFPIRARKFLSFVKWRVLGWCRAVCFAKSSEKQG